MVWVRWHEERDVLGWEVDNAHWPGEKEVEGRRTGAVGG